MRHGDVGHILPFLLIQHKEFATITHLQVVISSRPRSKAAAPLSLVDLAVLNTHGIEPLFSVKPLRVADHLLQPRREILRRAYAAVN